MEVKKKHRIYALIIGETLIKGEFMNCEIQKMSFAEQLKRKFAPLQGVFSKSSVKNYETYATFLPYVDPLRIRSKYVISYNSYELKPSDALGDAISHIDKACRYLSIGQTQDIRASVAPDVASFSPYIYQIVKIYSLDDKGNEVDARFKISNSWVRSLRRPERDNWRDKGTADFLKGIVEFRDQTLERSLKYLYRSSIGQMILDSPEKRALDHFKSIEIIINSLSSKREFTDRLAEAKTKLGLSDKEIERMTELWDERSNFGDIAHPSAIDQAERYPNQFPIPSNVHYTGLLDSTAGRVMLKYYDYKKNNFSC